MTLPHSKISTAITTFVSYSNTEKVQSLYDVTDLEDNVVHEVRIFTDNACGDARELVFTIRSVSVTIQNVIEA